MIHWNQDNRISIFVCLDVLGRIAGFCALWLSDYVELNYPIPKVTKDSATQWMNESVNYQTNEWLNVKIFESFNDLIIFWSLINFIIALLNNSSIIFLFFINYIIDLFNILPMFNWIFINWLVLSSVVLMNHSVIALLVYLFDVSFINLFVVFWIIHGVDHWSVKVFHNVINRPLVQLVMCA